MTHPVELSIEPSLGELAPDLALGVVRASVVAAKRNDELWREIEQRSEALSGRPRDSIRQIPEVEALNRLYKGCGKDPSRYRGSAEALLRRIVAKQGLYQVNTVVDINNLISLESFCSVGTYDMGKLRPPLRFGIGQAGEAYRGIGKSEVNIQDLPVFRDELGAYGSPTSDSRRSMITLETREVLLVVISLAASTNLAGYTARVKGLLEKYCGASETVVWEVGKKR